MCVVRRYFSIHIKFCARVLNWRRRPIHLCIYDELSCGLLLRSINANVCRVEFSLFIFICIFLFIIKSYTTVQYGDILSQRFLGWVADRADRCLILAAATFSFLYEQTTHRCHLHGQLSLSDTAKSNRQRPWSNAATWTFQYEQNAHRFNLHWQLSLLHTANATFSVLECTLNN